MRKHDSDRPYFTAKRLAGVIAGDIQCLWSVWIPSRFWYKKRPSDFDFVTWQARHQELLTIRKSTLETDEWAVRVEGQNKFEIVGQQAKVTGKPDIVAEKDNVVLVSDAKTGQPRATDAVQVLVYMAMIPLVRPELKEREFRGELVYPAETVPVPALTDEMTERIFRTVKELAAETPPPTSPSAEACRFCDLDECVDRVEGAVAPTQVTEF